jgi:hypothetical protein
MQISQCLQRKSRNVRSGGNIGIERGLLTKLLTLFDSDSRLQYSARTKRLSYRAG